MNRAFFEIFYNDLNSCKLRKSELCLSGNMVCCLPLHINQTTPYFSKLNIIAAQQAHSSQRQMGTACFCINLS